MKLLRTIRLDPSDTFVFATAAEPGEWAVTGSFLFADADPDQLGPKDKAALRAGFLGVDSFGWSTLAVVSEASEAERRDAAERLARRFVERLGAPDLATALPAAEEEIAFSASLCDHPVNTLIALHRVIDAHGLHEQFRTLHQREPMPGSDGLHAYTRAFVIEEFGDDEPEERVDLLSLDRGAGKDRA